ncbi:MAG: hypothetical protein HZY76_21510 [Anaerolineae bacterium]|nr:MAG: hypothetical protein HZY76_21510 [Anaerolineae bacterium]
MTDGAGAFDFGPVAGGNYSVSITPPPGYVATTATSVGITVAGGPVIVNFGIQPASTSTPVVVTATPTPTSIIVVATPTPTPVVVTATPTPTPNIIIWTATPTPTPGIIIVTATPTPTPGIIVVTATPTAVVVTNTPTPTSIVQVVTNTPTNTPLPPTPTGTPVPPGCNQWVQNSSFEEPLMLIDPGWVIFRQPLMPACHRSETHRYVVGTPGHRQRRRPVVLIGTPGAVDPHQCHISPTGAGGGGRG